MSTERNEQTHHDRPLQPNGADSGHVWGASEGGARGRAIRALQSWWEYVAGGIITVIALCLAIPVHRFVSRVRNAIGFDDGYTIALADRLMDGSWLPYVDGLSHRGPLLYWATALSLAVTERLSWIGPRWLVIVTFFLAAAGCFAAGAAARRPIAGAIGTTFYVFAICAAFPANGALALAGEKVSAPFCMASLTLAAIGVVRARTLRLRVIALLLAGAAAALAGLAKQTALLLVVPIAIWAGATALARDHVSTRARWLEACAIPAGWTGLLTLVLLPYAVSGNLGAFYYWFVEYNAKIYMEPYPAASVLPQIAAWFNADPWTYFAAVLLPLTPVCRGLAAFLGSPRRAGPRLATFGFEFTTASSALIAMLSSAAAFRIWPHYFTAVLTYYGVLIGVYVDDALRAKSRADRARGTIVTSLVLLGLVAALALSRAGSMVAERKGGGWAPAEPEPICDFVHRHSAPGQKIFIWGFDGDLYLTCKRGPATSFTYLTFVAGIVPPLWSDRRPTRVVPGAPERLVRELRAARPPVILDAPQRLGGISVRAVPEVKAVLEEAYCQGPVIHGNGGRHVTAYVLRTQPSCPRF